MDFHDLVQPQVAAAQQPQAYAGRISRISGGQAFAVIPSLSTEYEHGPLTVASGGPAPAVGTDVLVNFDEKMQPWIAGAPPEIPHELPAGGAAGQVLEKASGTDYDVEWATPAPSGLVVVGTWAAGRPAASSLPSGTQWYATDKLMTWVTDGSAWWLLSATPTVSATRPANPIDGQRWEYPFSGSRHWRFVWRDSAGVWLAEGDQHGAYASTTVSSGALAAGWQWTANGLAWLVPLKGGYAVDYGATIFPAGGSGHQVNIGIYLDSSGPLLQAQSNTFDASGNSWPGASYGEISATGADGTQTMRFAAYTSAGGSIGMRWWNPRPLYINP